MSKNQFMNINLNLNPKLIHKLYLQILSLFHKIMKKKFPRLILNIPNINYRMINLGNSTYLEEETSKNITTSASSKFYV